jgi:hypothetical protein
VSTSGPWRSGEVLAWTDHDGVGRPPRGPGRVATVILASTLAVVLTGLMSYDPLCAEHRSWVVLLSVLGVVGTAAAIVGLVQARALAPLLTVFVSLTGVSIGLIDAVHDPSRGRLIAVAFGLTAVLGAALTARALPLALWDRRVLRRLAPAPVAPHVASPPVAEAAPVPPAVVDGEPTPSAPG